MLFGLFSDVGQVSLEIASRSSVGFFMIFEAQLCPPSPFTLWRRAKFPVSILKKLNVWLKLVLAAATRRVAQVLKRQSKSPHPTLRRRQANMIHRRWRLAKGSSFFGSWKLNIRLKLVLGSVYEAAPMLYGTRPSGCPPSDRLEPGLNICRGSLVQTK